MKVGKLYKCQILLIFDDKRSGDLNVHIRPDDIVLCLGYKNGFNGWAIQEDFEVLHEGHVRKFSKQVSSNYKKFKLINT
jgi:hypothetical protein